MAQIGSWSDVEPGDIGHSGGQGWYGKVIRWATRGQRAHSFVFIAFLGQVCVPTPTHWLSRLLFAYQDRGWAQKIARWWPYAAKTKMVEHDQVWLTVEATAGGVGWRLRTQEPVEVQRVWRDATEQTVLVNAAIRQAGQGLRYDWMQVARLGVYLLTGRRWAPTRKDPDPHKMFCSESVSWAVLAARPDLLGELPYPPWEIWPNRLARALDVVQWRDIVTAA